MKNRIPKPTATTMDMVEYMEIACKEFDLLGEGGFASVFKIDENEVIKVGPVNEDHYLQYVAAIGYHSDNVHLPRIYDVKVYDTDTTSPWSRPYYTVIMERLFSSYDLKRILEKRYNIEYDDASRLLQDYFTGIGLDGVHSLAPGHIEELVPFTAEMREVRDLLLSLYKTDARADMADRNIMWRYDSVTGEYDAVITDPVV